MDYQGRVINTRTGEVESRVYGQDEKRVTSETLHYLVVYSQDEPHTAEVREGRKKWIEI